MLLLLLACQPTPDADTDTPTWHQDVAPIVSASCLSCHVDGELAGFLPLDTYSAAAPLASILAERASSGAMPPFMASETEECDNPWGFQHDPRLTDAQKDTLVAWADAGAPQGDPATAAPLPGPIDGSLDGASVKIVPASSYTTSLDQAADEFVCYSIPLGNDVEQWLTGIEVVPDQREVVHHVTLFLDEDGASAELAGEDGLYDCFGGTMLSGTTFLGAWVPGASAMQTPAGSGWPVAAGARLVAQIHYHPIAEDRTDQTSYKLRWAEQPPAKTAYVTLLGNDRDQQSDGSGLQPGAGDQGGPEFRIPAGAPSHEELIRWDVPEGVPEMSVWFVLNHMHYIGVDMKVWIERGDGSGEDCLLQTPAWDFDWQQSFYYDAASDNAPILRGGDTIWLRCTYDNTLDNPSVVDVLAENGLSEPQDVYLGEGSLDEMCMVGIGVVPR